MFDSMSNICGYKDNMIRFRTEIIMFLRTINIIVLPTLFSFLYLNDCGKKWTGYWNKCVYEKGVFDQYETIDAGDTSITVQISSSSDICDPTSFNDIDYNKCIRSFFFKWSIVVMEKLFVLS